MCARVCHPNARTYVRLLGPCFKTGRLKPFRQDLEYACPEGCTMARTVVRRSQPRQSWRVYNPQAGYPPATIIPRPEPILTCSRAQTQKYTTCKRPRTRTKNARMQHWFQSLPFQQFQVLFNSLFKVLCIFRSRYLFAIGLAPVFSFRRNLPPTLSCSPKQLDSSNGQRTARTPSHVQVCHLLWKPFSKGLKPGPCLPTPSIDYNSGQKARFSI